MNKPSRQNNESISDLQAEIARLQKIIDVLAARAEQPMDTPNSAYSVFQSTILLEDQVRTRTRELEAALLRNEKISRELHEAGERMEQSEKRFRNIFEYAPNGITIVDTNGRFFLANQAFCAMVGYDREALSSMSPLDITHPEDRADSRLNMQLLTRGEAEVIQMEKRYLRKDGKVIWVHLTTTLLRDAVGNPQFFIGQAEDVSAQRQAEEQLRLAATVYEHSNEAMMITDHDNRIIATNPAFTALTGYSAEEALGHNPSFLSSGHQNADFYRQLWQVLETGHHWEGDIWNRKKNGAIYAQWMSINAVLDARGRVQNYVALFSDITDEKKAAEKIWEHANYDALTRLPNRRLFHDRLEQAIKMTDRADNVLALFFIDLDRFKEVNDTLGHQMGDLLLVQVAERITSEVRASDTVARLGGDEFTVILPNISDADDARRIAKAILETLARPFLIEQAEIHVSCSIGIALYPQHAQNIDDLIRLSDAAMYRSKQQGRNGFSFADSP